MTYVTLRPGLKRGAFTQSRGYDLNPPVDIVEDGNAYAIEFDVPGFKKDDIHVAVNENVLTVTGERKREVVADEKFFRYFERPEGAFSRSFTLPEHVDADAIKASFTNGVLRLDIPKVEEAKPRVIDIK